VRRQTDVFRSRLFVGKQRRALPVQRWVTSTDVTHAGAVRRQVVAYAAEHGVADAVLRDLSIAVAELVTNVLRHDTSERDASISIDVREDCVTVTVRGAGARLSPDLNGAAAHRGMVIVAAVAHDVRVAHTEDGGRELSMTLLRDIEASSAT
jgi:anti-sigma regulatory factor (Ser/Thr protein kinase)